MFFFYITFYDNRRCLELAELSCAVKAKFIASINILYTNKRKKVLFLDASVGNFTPRQMAQLL